MDKKESITYWVKIYIAGDIHTIEKICRDYCFKVGLCVTVTPTKYIYTGGAEEGAEVGLINYPRFPNLPDDIFYKAERLAEELMEGNNQWSYTIMTPDKTIWYTRREEQ